MPSMSRAGSRTRPRTQRRWKPRTLYAAWATLSPGGRRKHRRGLLFKVPHRLDMHHLVPVETVERDGVTMLRLPEERLAAARRLRADRPRHRPHRRARPGELLHLVPQPGQGQLLAAACRKRTASFKKSVFGVTLAGCPLDEKISEMNMVKARGNPIGALAIVAVDNPMCAATGHRICNDCMKACIYQKQEPVDIPQVETRTLKDVLELPWGFEIYSLLTRWNPLELRAAAAEAGIAATRCWWSGSGRRASRWRIT